MFQACQNNILCAPWYLKHCQSFMVTSHWQTLLTAPISLVPALYLAHKAETGLCSTTMFKLKWKVCLTGWTLLDVLTCHSLQIYSCPK